MRLRVKSRSSPYLAVMPTTKIPFFCLPLPVIPITVIFTRICIALIEPNIVKDFLGYFSTPFFKFLNYFSAFS